MTYTWAIHINPIVATDRPGKIVSDDEDNYTSKTHLVSFKPNTLCENQASEHKHVQVPAREAHLLHSLNNICFKIRWMSECVLDFV